MEGQYPNWQHWGKGSTQTSLQGVPNTCMPCATTTVASTLQTNSAVASAHNANAPQCLAFLTLAGASDPLVTYTDSAAHQHFFANRANFETYGLPGMDDRMDLL